ncbi:hypothetical protein D3C71_1306980 [compost metagenome]
MYEKSWQQLIGCDRSFKPLTDVGGAAPPAPFHQDGGQVRCFKQPRVGRGADDLFKGSGLQSISCRDAECGEQRWRTIVGPLANMAVDELNDLHQRTQRLALFDTGDHQGFALIWCNSFQ